MNKINGSANMDESAENPATAHSPTVVQNIKGEPGNGIIR